MRHLLMIVALSVLVALAGAIGAADEPDRGSTGEPTAREILDRYVDALGGRDAIERLSSRVCIGKETTDLTSREQPMYESFYLEANTRVPMDYRLQESCGQGGHLEGFDGKVGWVKDKCGVRTETEVGSGRLAFLLNPRGPLHIDEYFPLLSYDGTAEVNGVQAFVLKPDSLKPAHNTLYFDTESGLLIRIGYFWTIEDYREVDGVLFPHRISTSRKGGSTVYKFETVMHNVAMRDSLFVMPEE
jgi:hypothetical protein